MASSDAGGTEVHNCCSDDVMALNDAIESQNWERAGTLLRRNPGLAQQHHPKHGWRILHWLCSLGGTPAPLIDLVASLYPEAVSMRDTYIGDTSLHLVCRHSQLTSLKVMALLKYYDRDAALIRNNFGGTALHSAANHNAILPVLQTLVEFNPMVLSITTHEGLYALSALWYAFCQTIPGHMAAIRIMNGEHGVESPMFDRFWSKCEYLAVQQFYRSTLHPKMQPMEDEELFVLHGLLKCNVPIDMLRVAMCHRPEATRIADSNGNLPLHILLENRPYRLKEREALSSYLKAAGICHDDTNDSVGFRSAAHKNKAGDLPLHIAIRNKIPYENGIDLVVEAFPQGVEVPDQKTGLFPFLLAAAQGSNLLATNSTFKLLRRQPNMLGRSSAKAMK
jgi:ankyrin repeat protein